MLIAAAALVGGLATPPPLAAQDGDRLECCLLLVVPVGARASALGGSATALEGPGAAFWNPAGLAHHSGGRFVIHHSDNVSVNTQVEAFSLLSNPFGAGLALSYQLFDKGEIPTTDPFGMPTGELALRDHLIIASVGVPLGAGFSGGVGYRFFQERIDCTGQCGGEERVAATSAVDLGVRYAPDWAPALELGLAVINLGPGLKVEEAPDANPFPGRLHIGVAYDLLSRVELENEVALRLAVDARDRLLDPGSPRFAIGLELDVQQAVFLRAGYAPGEGLGTGAAVGLELRYDRFDIAVSRSFVNSQLGADSEPFQVSFGVNF